MSTPRWGDEFDDDDDDDDDDDSAGLQVDGSSMIAAGTTTTTSGASSSSSKIPPTHKSRIDAKGIQIVTSYRPHPANPNHLWKTVTKVKVTTERRREPIGVQVRRQQWKKFGDALQDGIIGAGAAGAAGGDGTSSSGGGTQRSTIHSKDEVFLEDPNADTDLQDEDVTKAISGNLNAFWAKQQRRQLERKYDVTGSSGGGDADGTTGAAAGGGAGAGAGSGWTQVGIGGGTAAGSGMASAAGAGGAGASGKYIPPAQRAGLTGPGGGGPSSSSAFKPERRDDLNTIRVTNISENTSEADLQDLFQRFGRISRVYLAKDKETFVSRGFAFVSFVNKDDAAKAMEALQGYGYDHLILKLEWARPNAPKDPATSGTEFRSGYGKALAQDTTSKVSYASNLTK